MALALLATACSSNDDEAPATPPPPPPPPQPQPLAVKPGPALLYQAAPRAAPLENTGVWQAAPILISGTSAYRKGEFLYQDYLYDDLGAGAYTYPTNDAAYFRNAADFVELRVRPLETELAIRITYNSMGDPARIGTSIALGSSTAVRPFPHGANASAPAQIFVTTWGSGGDIVNAANGQLLGSAKVTVDAARRQLEVRVPYAYFDPRALRNMRIAAGVGLWDAAAGAYLIPQATADATHPGGAGALALPPAFFNLAFRYLQAAGGDFRNGTQSTALQSGDISAFAGSIDFVKLASGIDDDMVDTPTGRPSTGWINRILASNFEKQQGRIATGSRGSACALSRPCDPTYAGQLQPYSVYIPTKAAPAGGYGLTFDLHAAGGSHNSNNGPSSIAPTRQIAFGERAEGSLVVTVLARGTDLWYYGYGLADVFEVWADLMRSYKIDMGNVVTSGISMGGYGSYKLASMFPDLFAAIAPSIGCPSAGTGMNAPTVYPGGANTAVLPHLDSLRHVPATVWVGTLDTTCSYVNGQRPIGDRLQALNYRYEFRAYQGMGHANPPSFQEMADYVGARKVLANPAHITFVRDIDSDEPALGIVADHVYWASDIKLRDTSTLTRGTLDIVTKGLGTGDAPPQTLVTGSGLLTASFFPWVQEGRDWGAAPALPVANEININATNIASLVIDGTRAKVDCAAKINVVSDGPLSVKIAGCP